MRRGVISGIAVMYAILIGVNFPAPLLGLWFESDGCRARTK
jgi:hypothetical protein